jgi:peptidoglycan/LPS O-acetylase OafA/YrhL
MIRGYRRDIDGLRAVAIITVVAFHSGWTLFRTGFVGVDVFFVISGYLIGSMIIDDVQAGRFSLLGFYERRIRRIFPALAVMLFGASILASLYLLPRELEAFGKSLVAATFSFSNFYFANALNGYFAPSDLNVPLLHTWSLAIEEQFYVFLPLFVLVVYRLKPRFLWPAVVLAALASFALSLHDGLNGVTDDFFMPHVRAWELLLGTLVASPYLRLPDSAALRELLGLLGLSLILVAVFLPLHGWQFPGYAAALPCGGTALVILAGREGETLITRAMCRGPILLRSTSGTGRSSLS